MVVRRCSRLEGEPMLAKLFVDVLEPVEWIDVRGEVMAKFSWTGISMVVLDVVDLVSAGRWKTSRR